MGLACFSEAASELQLSQVIDTSHAYRFVATEVASVAPDLVILLDTAHSDANGVNQAVQDAASLLPDCCIRRVPRSAFDDTKGLELIQQYSLTDTAAMNSICSSSYLAVGCAGACCCASSVV